MSKVCIIGGGVCGVVSVKTCLDYGLVPVCFEASEEPGGLWRYKPGEVDGESAVMWTTIANTSKEMMAFSDFPAPQHFPNYMRHDNLLEYIKLYMTHFNIHPHIRYNHKVISVTPSAEHGRDGSWDVTVTGGQDRRTTQHRFKHVMIASGGLAYPNVPDIPGLDKCTAQILHTQQYRMAEPFRSKRVLVVGGMNSGIDAAVDVSNAAEQVYLSARNGSWVAPRLIPGGKPVDVAMLTRFITLLRRLLPRLLAKLTERAMNERMDHRAFGIRPPLPPGLRFALNDDLPLKLQSGAIRLRKGIDRIEGRTVVFDTGEHVDVDAIVLGTGYHSMAPYLARQNGRLNVDRESCLYHLVFPPENPHGSLAAIGFVRVAGPVWPLVELQARLACSVFTGAVRLPPTAEMQQWIQRPTSSFYVDPVVGIYCSFVPYIEELAQCIGARPRFFKLLLTDPRLAAHVFFGPCLPYTFRLHGMHSGYMKARERIMTVNRRIWAPLGGDVTAKPIWNLPRVFAALVLMVAVLFSVK